MLSESMQRELLYFLSAVLYGSLAAACYHPLLFLRTVIKHARAFVDAEDILYLSVAGFCFFLVAYVQNNGILRWYAYAGAALGLWLYKKSGGLLLEKVRMWLLQKLGKPFTIKKKRRNRNKEGRLRNSLFRKGKVSVDEGSSPKHKSKKEKKKRSEADCSDSAGAVCSHHL